MADNFSRTERLIKIKEFHRDSLQKIFDDLQKDFLNSEKIKKVFLKERTTKFPDSIDVAVKIDLIDNVRKSFMTAMQFGDFHRAVRYLAALDMLCKKFLN